MRKNWCLFFCRIRIKLLLSFFFHFKFTKQFVYTHTKLSNQDVVISPVQKHRWFNIRRNWGPLFRATFKNGAPGRLAKMPMAKTTTNRLLSCATRLQKETSTALADYEAQFICSLCT